MDFCDKIIWSKSPDLGDPKYIHFIHNDQKLLSLLAFEVGEELYAHPVFIFALLYNIFLSSAEAVFSKRFP